MSPQRRDGCPLCGKPVETEFRPFCSKRCKDLDLARWLKGHYAIPTSAEKDEDEEQGPGRPANDDAGEI
jgi:endogenous inhibitor of DNA gyrase (YacG/DUF329 family)